MGVDNLRLKSPDCGSQLQRGNQVTFRPKCQGREWKVSLRRAPLEHTSAPQNQLLLDPASGQPECQLEDLLLPPAKGQS
jgi:endogenous inhibitor of DNA gyrase (YacG/DUF329 family)